MAAGCGLFVSEEALNVWVCLFYWYLLLYQLNFDFSLLQMHSCTSYYCLLFSINCKSYFTTCRADWHFFGSKINIEWNMELICSVILKQCTIYHFHSSLGLLVCLFICMFFRLWSLLGYSVFWSIPVGLGYDHY